MAARASRRRPGFDVPQRGRRDQHAPRARTVDLGRELLDGSFHGCDRRGPGCGVQPNSDDIATRRPRRRRERASARRRLWCSIRPPTRTPSGCTRAGVCQLHDRGGGRRRPGAAAHRVERVPPDEPGRAGHGTVGATSWTAATRSTEIWRRRLDIRALGMANCLSGMLARLNAACGTTSWAWSGSAANTPAAFGWRGSCNNTEADSAG